MLAVLGSGLFSAAFILALQGVLLSLLGEQWFRRLSLVLQGLSISVLLMLLLLFPVLSGAVPVLLQSGSAYVLYCPPFWFLGIYQRLLEGPSALPIYASLAKTGCAALVITVVVAALAYPLAYLRRVRQLVVGPGTHDTRSWVARPLHALLHATLLQVPVRRSVFHFISQTLLRVQRYRIYLVLYGGVGLSVVVASVLRLAVVHGQVHFEISADGIRAAIAIVAFWTIAGLRMAFVSPGNRQGSWVFRIVHGRPPHLDIAMQLLQAAKLWVLLWAGLITFAAFLVFRALAPAELLTWPATASLLLIAAALCILLTDALFLNVKTVAFTGEPAKEQSNLALTVLKYFTFLPAIVWLPVFFEPWIEASVRHFGLAVAATVAAHFALRRVHCRIVREHCNMPGLEDDEDDFPMKLGLRY
jgi:heme/copper-type cytochrome/quinol oxidase subunit 3